MNTKKKVDNYSILIVANYLQSKEDYINLICVCKNFKKTLKKMRYNPISVTSTKLFPYMQTHYIYDRKDRILTKEVDAVKVCFPVPYSEVLLFDPLTKNTPITYSNVTVDNDDSKHITLPLDPRIRELQYQCFKDITFQTIVIPSTITKIHNSIFLNNEHIRNVSMKECLLETLPNYIFKGCINLTSIELPKCLQRIGMKCFKSCSELESIDIPEKVTEIGISAFRSCIKLKSIELPSEEKLYVIENIDATIIAQQPKMKPHIPAMRQIVADTLGLELDQINIKATTEEGLGFTGAMEGIASQAICSISSIYDKSYVAADSNNLQSDCEKCSGCRRGE